jgi:hypothetical protein
MEALMGGDLPDVLVKNGRGPAGFAAVLAAAELLALTVFAGLAVQYGCVQAVSLRPPFHALLVHEQRSLRMWEGCASSRLVMCLMVCAVLWPAEEDGEAEPLMTI